MQHSTIDPSESRGAEHRVRPRTTTLRKHVRPPCSALLLELARQRNAQLATENLSLRAELETVRGLLDDALALAGLQQDAAAQSRRPKLSAPAPLTSRAATRRVGGSGTQPTQTAALSKPPRDVGTARRYGDGASVPMDGEALEARRLARQSQMTKAIIRIQAGARGLNTRTAIQRYLAEERAITRLQAQVRGNAGRGIAERRKYAAALPTRLVHRKGHSAY